jgi:Protein of unknown function (DUF2934)
MAEATETVKKAKTPAKPRAAAAKKTAATTKPTVAERVTATMPTHAEIAQLARRYWEERGAQDGRAEQDWLRAERELRQKAS